MNIEACGTITPARLGYSVEEAAEHTSLSKSYLRKKIRDGELEATYFGRRVVILSDELDRFMKSGSARD